MDVKRRFKEKPIEIVAGLAMVVVGGIIVVIVLEPWVKVVASVLAALGGALISWSAAGVGTIDDAKRVLKADLETVSRHLATATGQITTAIQTVSSGTQEPVTGIALISQSTSTLYSLVNDLQILAGSQFESANLLATVNICEEMARDLGVRLSSLSGDDEPTKDAETVESLQAVVESMLWELGSAKREMETPSRKKVTETIPCPECDQSVTVRIGTAQGDTAMARCASCNAPFNAHRSPDGSVFTRKIGAQPGFKPVTITCPECKIPFDARLAVGAPGKMLYCLKCYERIYVNGQGHVERSEKSTPTEALSQPGSFWAPDLTCPECNVTTTAFAKDGATVFAVCRLCDRLLINRQSSEAAEG